MGFAQVHPHWRDQPSLLAKSQGEVRAAGVEGLRDELVWRFFSQPLDPLGWQLFPVC
jgi:hypothetical protein